MAKSPPKHFFMIAALLTYERQELENGKAFGKPTPKQRHMNTIMELPRRAVTAADLNQARLAMFQRLADETGEPFRGVKDIVFLNFAYLGHMSPEEFHNQGKTAPETTKH